jgi:chromosome segregation ATPase
VEGFPETRLRRAWLRGYRTVDVELTVAQLRLSLQATEQELASATRRVDELTQEVGDLRERDLAVRAKEIELIEALSAVRQERERLGAEAEARARELVLDAEAQAAEARSEALVRVEELERQTDALLALRHRLVANVRLAVEEIQSAVRTVDRESPRPFTIEDLAESAND